jgi:hypothetical protein
MPGVRKSPQAKAQEEASMRKDLLLMIFVSTIFFVSGSVTSSASQNSVNAHHKRINRHVSGTHPGTGITSFSSSSALHIGVGYRPGR